MYMYMYKLCCVALPCLSKHLMDISQYTTQATYSTYNLHVFAALVQKAK